MKPEEKVYLAFFKEKKLYYNQIKDLTSLSHSSLQNSLKKLIKSNILTLLKTKSNTFYQIANKKHFSLKFSEIAMNQFEELNANIKIPLKHFLKDITKEIYTIVLFGSASIKQEKKGSDIDLLIVANKKINLNQNKKEAEISSKYPLSIFQTTIKEFIENKDDIIIQARKTGFPIYKEQNYYEEILNEY